MGRVLVAGGCLRPSAQTGHPEGPGPGDRPAQATITMGALGGPHRQSGVTVSEDRGPRRGNGAPSRAAGLSSRRVPLNGRGRPWQAGLCQWQAGPASASGKAPQLKAATRRLQRSAPRPGPSPGRAGTVARRQCDKSNRVSNQWRVSHDRAQGDECHGRLMVSGGRMCDARFARSRLAAFLKSTKDVLS